MKCFIVVIILTVVEEKFKKATYKSDLVFWKGYQLGFLTLKNGEKLTIKISSYGDFFQLMEFKITMK